MPFFGSGSKAIVPVGPRRRKSERQTTQSSGAKVSPLPTGADNVADDAPTGTAMAARPGPTETRSLGPTNGSTRVASRQRSPGTIRPKVRKGQPCARPDWLASGGWAAHGLCPYRQGQAATDFCPHIERAGMQAGTAGGCRTAFFWRMSASGLGADVPLFVIPAKAGISPVRQTDRVRSRPSPG